MATMNPMLSGFRFPDKGAGVMPLLVLAGSTGISGGFGATTRSRRPPLE
jgi:hypothetical protein